jgi:hypothetical protein
MTRRHIEGKELTRLDRFPDRALQRPPSLLERAEGSKRPHGYRALTGSALPKTSEFMVTSLTCALLVSAPPRLTRL